jgi:3-oxoadipate enol-lactonase
LAAELIALLDDFGIERAHLGGLSLGGMVAMYVAATRPDRVDRLALVCTSAQMPASGWRERAALVRANGTTAIADGLMPRWFTPAFTQTPAAAALRDDLLQISSEGYAGCCDALAQMDLRPLLPKIQAPTLVIAGAEDPATPLEHARTIAEGIEAGATPVRLKIVDGAAHLSSVECPEEVGRLMVEHLKVAEVPGGATDGQRRE